MTSAADAAAKVIEGIEKGSYRVVIGKDARMLDRLSPAGPRRAMDLIAKRTASLLSQ